ncbi:unnamed protein product [Cuscuta campestris]|uniref:TF-B3 domain-containing protein n=1 Tax=Cuscuta campestris TaxID=132261 RepID=A0A484M9B8_9ASTE|nr:unnamed protein product [Cuscuta campestris]
MAFLKEEEYDDLPHLLLGCNPAKKRSLPVKKRPRCDNNNNGFLQEEEEEEECDLHHHLLLGCNPAKKRRSLPVKKLPRCDDNKNGFLKEEEEECDFHHLLLLGCNPTKKRSLPVKRLPRCDENNNGFLRPAFPLHQPQTMTRFDWLLLAAETAQQELEDEKKGIALQSLPHASKENEKKRKASASAPIPLNKDNTNKRRKVTNNSASCLAAVVELPPDFRHKVREMKGKAEEAVLVIQKKLFESDTAPYKGRFSIPSKQVANDFLTPQEKQTLHSGTKIENVPLIEPDGTSVYPITLKKWDMSANCIYNLITNWNLVRERNRLVTGDLVQLWAFRAQPSQELCLAMVHLPTQSLI